MKYWMGFLFLGVCQMAHAYDFLPIRHVLVNATKDVMEYRFHFADDAACDSTGAISIGHMKEISCSNQALFKPGLYTLQFDQVYFYGKRKIRCSGTKTYEVGKHKKLMIWKLSKRCQLDVIDA